MFDLKLGEFIIVMPEIGSGGERLMTHIYKDVYAQREILITCACVTGFLVGLLLVVGNCDWCYSVMPITV
jgi:hypothetical protein